MEGNMNNKPSLYNPRLAAMFKMIDMTIRISQRCRKVLRESIDTSKYQTRNDHIKL